MKIGDTVYVHGCVDEIRKDTVIIRNSGGYFGTIPSEIICGEMPERNTGKWELDEKSLRHRCSECLSVASLDDHGKEVLSDYCGVCGSDMRGEEHG